VNAQLGSPVRGAAAMPAVRRDCARRPVVALPLAGWALAAGLLLAACTAKEPIPLTPKSETGSSPVVRRAVPEPAAPAVAGVAPSPAAPAPSPPLSFPANAIYVCVAETGGQRRETVIEFEPKVAELCRKHPEMGPCQYEREVCRRSGGRVYAANGVEITNATEAEYDRKVMRVRFRAN
jgi:hypothetical protein